MTVPPDLMRAMVLHAPGERLREEHRPLPRLERGNCCCACTPAASAAPIFMWSTVN